MGQRERFRWSVAVHLAEQALQTANGRARQGRDQGWELVGLGRIPETGQYRIVQNPADAYAHLGGRIRATLDGYTTHPLRVIAGSYCPDNMGPHFPGVDLRDDKDKATAVVAFALCHKSYTPQRATA
jgi:hypothetical protein